MKQILWAIAGAAFALSALAANVDQNVSVTDPTNGNTVGVNSSHQLSVNCVAGCSGSSSGVALTPSTTTESNHVLKASSGSLSSLTVAIGATSGWVLVFDATSAPADGAVTPKWWFPVASNGTSGAISAAWVEPAQFSTGVTVVFSTTGPFTKTASATAQFSGQVQ